MWNWNKQRQEQEPAANQPARVDDEWAFLREQPDYDADEMADVHPVDGPWSGPATQPPVELRMIEDAVAWDDQPWENDPEPVVDPVVETGFAVPSLRDAAPVSAEATEATAPDLVWELLTPEHGGPAAPGWGAVADPSAGAPGWQAPAQPPVWGAPTESPAPQQGWPGLPQPWPPVQPWSGAPQQQWGAPQQQWGGQPQWPAAQAPQQPWQGAQPQGWQPPQQGWSQPQTEWGGAPGWQPPAEVPADAPSWQGLAPEVPGAPGQFDPTAAEQPVGDSLPPHVGADANVDLLDLALQNGEAAGLLPRDTPGKPAWRPQMRTWDD